MISATRTRRSVFIMTYDKIPGGGEHHTMTIGLTVGQPVSGRRLYRTSDGRRRAGGHPESPA